MDAERRRVLNRIASEGKCRTDEFSDRIEIVEEFQANGWIEEHGIWLV